jgi:hypothetical protein
MKWHRKHGLPSTALMNTVVMEVDILRNHVNTSGQPGTRRTNAAAVLLVYRRQFQRYSIAKPRHDGRAV